MRAIYIFYFVFLCSILSSVMCLCIINLSLFVCLFRICMISFMLSLLSCRNIKFWNKLWFVKFLKKLILPRISLYKSVYHSFHVVIFFAFVACSSIISCFCQFAVCIIYIPDEISIFNASILLLFCSSSKYAHLLLKSRTHAHIVLCIFRVLHFPVVRRSLNL